MIPDTFILTREFTKDWDGSDVEIFRYRHPAGIYYEFRISCKLSAYSMKLRKQQIQYNVSVICKHLRKHHPELT
jgi:hypothetical protein